MGTIRKGIKVLLWFLSLVTTVSAKTFHLRSVGQTRPFTLRIYCTGEGKGAFVQYGGQQGFMSLRLIKYTISARSNSDKHPEGYYYEWDELSGVKVTGRYAVTEQSGNVTEAWYMRNKDGKKYNLTTTNENALTDSIQKYLLHGILITFPLASTEDKFELTYADGKIIKHNFLRLDAPDVIRSCYIKDYNFDGYDDLAFSLPDAGMGVYHIFDIWLYNPVSKRFEELKESKDARAKCSCLCDVTLDTKKKLLYTACRGGARWWQDVYQIGKNNRLIWLRSSENR